MPAGARQISDGKAAGSAAECHRDDPNRCTKNKDQRGQEVGFLDRMREVLWLRPTIIVGRSQFWKNIVTLTDLSHS